MNNQQDFKIRDGFYLETYPNRRIEGHSYETTDLGFYRKNFSTLIEDELYIYSDKNVEHFKGMYVVSGSYIKVLPSIDLTH